MTQTATRLITLILLLQRQPNQKAADLAKTLGISVRTLHRYFEMLDEMGIPIYTERGPHGGFSLVRGYKMPPLVLSPEEATVLYLGAGLVEEVWGSLYREATLGALAKLDNLLPEDQRQEAAWARRSLVATGLHRADMEAITPALEKLRCAVRECRQVEIRYQSSCGAQPEPRIVNPYALVHRWGWWYLAGFCHLRQEMRSFRVDRMEETRVLDNHFQMPAGFDIQAYLAQEIKDQPQFRVRLQFFSQWAYLARYNRANWEALEEQADGSVIVTLQGTDLNWAASFTLAYGPAVRVLVPEALKSLVAEWARVVAAQYQDSQFVRENEL